MPLLDHFRPPLHPRRRWESLHAVWATSIMSGLNGGVLPGAYFAEAQVHVGSRFEVDIGAFEDSEADPSGSDRGGPASVVAIAPRAWVVPKPMAALPAVYPDSLEVLIYADEGGAILAGAVELVSPGNKDRADAKRAFVAKCATYLQQGVGLVIVDIVTERLANLHDELAAFLGGADSMSEGTNLYASAYRPVRREQDEHHDVWTAPLALGDLLPTLPLALRRGPVVPLDLNASYDDACRRSRLI